MAITTSITWHFNHIQFDFTMKFFLNLTSNYYCVNDFFSFNGLKAQFVWFLSSRRKLELNNSNKTKTSNYIELVIIIIMWWAFYCIFFINFYIVKGDDDDEKFLSPKVTITFFFLIYLIDQQLSTIQMSQINHFDWRNMKSINLLDLNAPMWTYLNNFICCAKSSSTIKSIYINKNI